MALTALERCSRGRDGQDVKIREMSLVSVTDIIYVYVLLKMCYDCVVLFFIPLLLCYFDVKGYY